MNEFSPERVMLILARNGVRMSLQKAEELANLLVDVHSERVCMVENQAYERGIADGRKSVEIDASRELSDLRWMREQVLRSANEKVGMVVKDFGPEQKVRCIKELRAQVPGLGLRESKNIVDEYMATPPF